MIKLSDYLNYLHSEIIQARKLADEQSVEVAKAYAEHEYLRYFRVPRFTMPSVKLEIPVKISELDAETKFNFKMDEDSFVDELNTKITEINKAKKLNISPIAKAQLKDHKFTGIVKDLEKRDYRFIRKPTELMTRVDFGSFVKETDSLASNNNEEEKQELASLLKTTMQNRYQVVSAKLNNIYIDPDTNEADENKILVKLNVEMVEEGLRIVKGRNADGREFEEIIFE
ncbi:hypothetical protein [Tunicatimonas pelagia]|uniref:hypothetical protein n=1 Tax=Tunicatimonas pelagia TaxID=931531 RepID=UPI002665BFB9|nr:hypothetical protein [Tunicatimonas pelagia]WKN44619.1 hypothetical protein P0M28_06535 [Tunicatimonas pelagia]